MEKLADNSEPQVLIRSKNINESNFPSVNSVSIEEIALLLKLNKQMEN